MAGGPHAEHVACMTCMWDDSAVIKATRIGEGVETDWYRCEKGHEFGIDWDHGGPPSEPQWPPPAKTLEGLAMLDKIKK